MKDKENISKGPKRRDEACLQTLHGITIPAGTILRQEPGKVGVFSAPVGDAGTISITVKPGETVDGFKRVVA